MISFIGLRNRTAGKIRGAQLAACMNGNFYDFSELHSEDVKGLHDIVVIVRNRQDIQGERFLKQEGYILGFDLLDNPVSHLLFNDLVPELSKYVDDASFDFYIVNNTANAKELAEHTDKKIFVIPHHNMNILKERTCTGEEIKKVGYLGLPYGNEKAEKISQVCRDLGLEFVSKNSSSREECTEFLKTLDVGVVLVEDQEENNHGEAIRAYKPNVKLTNFQSFGIPTICSEYNSFLEFGEDCFLVANNLEEFEEQIKRLVADKKLRKDLSDRSYAVGSKLHILSVIEDYYFKVVEYGRKLSKHDHNENDSVLGA